MQKCKISKIDFLVKDFAPDLMRGIDSHYPTIDDVAGSNSFRQVASAGCQVEFLGVTPVPRDDFCAHLVSCVMVYDGIEGS